MAFEAVTGYGAMLDLLKEEATIDKYKADTAESAKRGQLYEEQAKALNTKQQVDARTRAAAQLVEQERAKAEAPDPLTQELTRREEEATDPINKAIVDAQREIKAQERLARQIRAEGGDIDDAVKADQARARAAENLFHNQNLKFEADKNKAKNLSQIAGAGLEPGADLETTVAGIDKIVPGWSRNAPVDRGRSFDGGVGPVVDGPKTREALRQVQMQGATVHDQLADKQNQVTNEYNQNRLLLDRKKVEDKKLVDDKKAVIERDKLTATEGEYASRKTDREARRKLAEEKAALAAKPVKYKEPTEGAVKDQGAKYTSEHKLPEADAKLAARDHHRLVHDFMQANKADPSYTREDARADADEIIRERIVQPPEPGKRKVLGVEIPGTEASQKERPKYDRSKATPDFGQAETTPEGANTLEAKSFDAVVSTPGKHIVETKPDAASVREGTVLTNPDGSKEKAVGGKWVKM